MHFATKLMDLSHTLLESHSFLFILLAANRGKSRFSTRALRSMSLKVVVVVVVVVLLLLLLVGTH